MKSPVGRVRVVGLIEGVSFILLMGVAMPLKYLADQPLAVTYVGWAHGVLFLLLCWFLMQAWAEKHLTFGLSCLTFLAALLPFGPFIIDHWLKKQDANA